APKNPRLPAACGVGRTVLPGTQQQVRMFHHVCLSAASELQLDRNRNEATRLRSTPMPTLLCNFAALMVAGLFYSWRAYSLSHIRRLRTLRERVAYMLWMMAQTIDVSATRPAP